MDRCRSATFSLVGFAGAVLIAAPSCEEADQFSVDRVVTSTVAVSAERRLVIDSPVALDLRGETSIDDIYASLEATITASSAARARDLADALDVAVEHLDSSTLKLTLPPPKEAALSGTLRLRVPARFDASVFARGGAAMIDSLQGTIAVSSVSHVRVERALGNVEISVSSGNVLLDTALFPGGTTRVEVGLGDIELKLPEALSADIDAAIRSQGEVLIAHPRLLPAVDLDRRRYHAVVAGGLSVVRLVTGTGRIVIRAR